MKRIAAAIQNFRRSDAGRFFGEDKSMNVFGGGDPMERRMGLKWRVAPLPDDGQGFSSPAFGTQSRVDMRTHARTHSHVSALTCTCSRTYISSATRYLVLTHYLTLRSPRRSVSQRLPSHLLLLLRDPFLLGTEWATKRFSFARGANEVSHERSCATNSLQPKYFLSRTVRQVGKTRYR